MNVAIETHASTVGWIYQDEIEKEIDKILFYSKYVSWNSERFLIYNFSGISSSYMVIAEPKMMRIRRPFPFGKQRSSNAAGWGLSEPKLNER